MSKIEVNTVEPQCGTTLTLGGSGDTVTLGSGASQSGFGRTGTVDWQTGSIKTATFTAANGEGYFANTSGGAFTMNLPAGTAGSIVSVVDYTNTFQTNNLTISPNGSQKIGGFNEDASLKTEGQSVTFVYVDDTEGWKNVQDSTSNVIGAAFICASVSGSCNTLTTSGNCKIATFVGPGTFTVNSISNVAANNVVSYVVVAGGGGGGGDVSHGGGGGAGGFREYKSSVTPYTASPLDGNPCGTAVTVTATGFPITVGGGGARAASGANSIFSTITSTGGGAGANPTPAGGTGGSGGGALPPGTSGAAGNTPPVTPPQGNPGGDGNYQAPHYGAGGGGGAGAAGGPGTTGAGGAGGNGVASSITGSPVTRGGGGGGSSYQGGGPNPGGTGGGGAGTIGGPAPNAANAVAGTANTGGGGGGGERCVPSAGGATGGSGIVIIRYKFQ